MTAVGRDNRPPFPTFSIFLQHLREVFDHPKDGRSAGEHLLTLTQGRRSAAEYVLSFRTLVAQKTWKEDPLKVHFLFTAGNFMSLDFARERNISLKQIFIFNIRITHLTTKLTMITGVLHQETIQFHILSTSHAPIILGLPWLCRHNSNISWQNSQIFSWNENCLSCCIPPLNPLPLQTVSINETEIPELPSVYHDLIEDFSEIKAFQLPPHRSSDCAIDLLSGFNSPRECIFPLSQPESEAINEYIKEKLAKGFIQKSSLLPLQHKQGFLREEKRWWSPSLY